MRGCGARRGTSGCGAGAVGARAVLAVLLMQHAAPLSTARPPCAGAPHTSAPAAWRARHSALRPRVLGLRGGNYLDDVEPLEEGLTEHDIEKLHYHVGRDGSAAPQPPDFSQRVGNISIFDEDGDLDEQGATDGFPFDWTLWRPDARFHLGFRAPHQLGLNRSMYSTFDKGEMVVVARPDGAQRFAQVLERVGEGFVRGEIYVGHQYRVLLATTRPGTLPSDKILDSADIGKLQRAWEPGRDALDDACRLEAAAQLRHLGNGALNNSRLEEASRKYVKALAYLHDLDMRGDGAEEIVEEWVKVRLNLALVHLRSRQLHACVEGCDAVLQLRANDTKALYRSGQALRQLGRSREAALRLKEVFRERPGDIVVRKELSLCYDNFTMYLEDVNPILAEMPRDKLDTIKNVRVDSQGRRVLGDLQSAPAGWESGDATRADVTDENDNNTRAATLLQRLAEVDQLPDAQYNLGCYYSQGKGVAPNHELARKWFRRAAAQGHVRAQVNLAIQFWDGVGGKRNASEAFRWFSQAAAQGDTRAQRMVGVCYAEGRGVAQNKSEAVRCYLRAARSNDTRAQFNLGVCYQEAIGVEKDLHKAAKWYWRAANLGDPQAMYNLGCCYADGLGVQEDVSKASRWFAEAARRGYGPEVNDPKYGRANFIQAPSPAGAGGAASSAASAPASPGAGASEASEASAGEASAARSTAHSASQPVASSHASSASAASPAPPAHEPTEEEKRLFPGLVGLVQPAPAETPATLGVPQSIVEKLEEAEARRRSRGMHGEGDADNEDELSRSISDAEDEDLEAELRKADGQGVMPAAGRRAGKRWIDKQREERLIGDDETGMVPAAVGLRVRLSRACQGQGVKGEDGVGTIQWIGNQRSVCHVKWEGNPRFDYSYCIGYNGFYDLRQGEPAAAAASSDATRHACMHAHPHTRARTHAHIHTPSLYLSLSCQGADC
jgi:TPR repeat protein